MLAKKLISILLSLAMVSMLFGCGGRPSNDSGGSSPSTRAVANDAATVPEFATLDDPELLLYMQDSIYADLEAELVEDVKQGIWSRLETVYPNIPIEIME